MLVKNNGAKVNDYHKDSDNSKYSKLWLIIVLAVFFVIVVIPLWFVLKIGILYIPKISDMVFEPAEAEYIVEKKEVNENSLMYRVKFDQDSWYLTLSEEEVTYLLSNYMGEDWQMVLSEGQFEVFGPLVTAINNSDQWSYLKVIYIEDASLQFFFNDLSLPKFLENYIIEKYLLETSTEDLTSESKYFEKIELKENELTISGGRDKLNNILQNVDYDKVLESVINYFRK